MLEDEDFLVRIEGREIISNLAKAVGLSTMIVAIRVDLDSPKSEVRELAAQSFAVTSVALTIPKVLPFIKAVCGSKKSIYARHTGCKIIFYIAKMVGYGVLPHLKSLLLSLKKCLNDEIKMIKMSAALSVSVLA